MLKEEIMHRLGPLSTNHIIIIVKHFLENFIVKQCDIKYQLSDSMVMDKNRFVNFFLQ